MHQSLPLLLLLYILDSSNSGEVEETTLLRMDLVLSTEPTIFHYPRTEAGSGRTRHMGLRDVGGLPLPSSSPRYPPQIPYAPPPRSGFFTPPLPPEYLNPFAGKPTLRGSNSESPHGQRRPIPPPPPISRPPDKQDRVPLPPPDFPVPEMKPSGKKALNTPSRPNFHQTYETVPKDLLNAAKSDNPSSRHPNDTDFEFVPSIQYPSVSRILSGSSGRKHDSLEGDRHSGPNSRHHSFEQMAKNRPPFKEFVLPNPIPPKRPVEIHRPPPPPLLDTTLPPKNRTEVIPVVKVDDVIKRVNDSVLEEPVGTEHAVDAVADHEVAAGTAGGDAGGEGAAIGTLAWNVHDYLAASLFALLAACAVLNLILLRCGKHLLPLSCVVSILVLVAVIGVIRAVDLFHAGTLIEVHNLQMAACSLMIAAFGILLLFLARVAEARIVRPLGHPLCLFLVVLCHLTLCVTMYVDVIVNDDDYLSSWLLRVWQAVYIILCVCLGAGYLCMYKTLSSAAARKQVEVFGSVYTTDVRRSRPATLGLVVRLGLAVAMLVLLMALVQIAGAVAAPKDGSWLLWAYQSSVFVIELAICGLLVWVVVTRLPAEDEKGSTAANSTTGFALFPCAPCRQPDEHNDDIYPAVCSTNQAIHNYSLRTGKKLYDDAFPLNTLNTLEKRNGSLWNNYDEIGPGSEVVEVKDALTRTGLTTLPDRRPAGMAGLGGTLPDRRRRDRDLPGSMLVDENGFVRFRSLAADDALRRASPGNKSLPRRSEARDLRELRDVR